MKMLIEDIKNKQFKNIYLLTGEEIYLRNQYRKRLREALLDPEDTMNYASFEGKNINPKEVIDLAETMPAKLTAHTGMDAMTHAILCRSSCD